MAVLVKYTVIVIHLSSPLQTCIDVFVMSEREKNRVYVVTIIVTQNGETGVSP